MINKVKEYFKNYLSTNKTQLNVRVPDLISTLLNDKFAQVKKKCPDYEFSDFHRILLAEAILPELLMSELQNSNDWVTQEGKDCFELHFKNKIKKLQDIIELAQYAIDKTNEFQDKIISAEVQYLNDVNNKFSEGVE